ncbi:MAG: type III-B CRISPR module RAMP protein Cmr1 [Nitrospirae bacterium]|nr:type III-B CRISPR module RAMP protein Cmr1 [Nitrospirota bacterium]
MIHKVTFEIETITPMFLSGADQGKAELRAASIKGLLRFWWRALQAEPDLNKLRARESAIFGSSDEKTGGGCSFAIRINHDGNCAPVPKGLPNKDNIHKIMVTSRTRNRTFPINILEYLAYGPYDPKSKKLRQYIDSKSKFNLILNFHKDNYIDDIYRSIHVFSLFGGIGSRSRNGFGSFFISKIEGGGRESNTISSSTSQYSTDFLKKLIHDSEKDVSYPSFSHETKIFRAKQPKDTWDEALADVGKTYRGIRVGDKKLNGLVFESKHSYNKREFLGAPLDPYNENFHSLLERRAKPYFIKIAKEGNQFRSYILYLPSLYCEGLENDRKSKRINNHPDLNREFAKVCNEFNKFIGEHMEIIL